MSANVAQEQTRKKALTALALAIVITVGAWFFINAATDRGLARLQLIDRVYAVCRADYANAHNAADTSRVDLQPLIAAVDSGKAGAPHRCGDMRRPPDAAVAQDSARRAAAARVEIPTRTPR